MDSFSKVSKLEIINQQIDSVNYGVPLLFGFFTSSASYDEEKNVEFTTDIESLYEYLLKITKNIIKNYKKIQEKQKIELRSIVLFDEIILNDNLAEIIILKNNFKINEKIFYKIIFKDSILPEIFNLYNIKEENSITDNLTNVSRNVEEIKALVKGIYLGSATSSIKISEKPNEKTSSGYHLEFASKNLPLLRELSHILAQFDIYAKLISRKSIYVLYIKDAEHVSDLLALVGANNSVLTLKNEIVKRELR